MTQSFQCLHNHNIELIVASHCEGKCPHKLTKFELLLTLKVPIAISHPTYWELHATCMELHHALHIPLPISKLLYAMCWPPARMLLPFLLVLRTHRRFFHVLRGTRSVYISQLVKVCKWTPTHRATALVFVGGKPPWPTRGTTPPQLVHCGNSPMLVSQLSYPPPPLHISPVAPQGIQIAPTQTFANDPITKLLQKIPPHKLFPTAFSLWLPLCYNPIIASIPYPPTIPSTIICMPISTKIILKIPLTCFFCVTFGAFPFLASYVITFVNLLVFFDDVTFASFTLNLPPRCSRLCSCSPLPYLSCPSCQFCTQFFFLSSSPHKHWAVKTM